jgi:TRAP-type uncharacterized transport system substrate-binding protein
MKRNLKMAPVFVLLWVLAAGCGGGGASGTGAAPASGEKPVNLVYSTHSVGTSNYNAASLFANLWLKYLPEGSAIDVQPTSPGGMGAPYLFANGVADIAFINSAPARMAWDDGTLGKPPTREHRGIAGTIFGNTAVIFLTQNFLDKYKVASVEDALRRKLPIRIGSGAPGSMDEKVVSLLCEYLQISYDDIKKWGGDVVFGNGSDLAAMVKDNMLDGICDLTSAQSSTMVEISMTAKVVFQQLEPATVEWFGNKGFAIVDLPAGSFTGQPGLIRNPGAPDCVFVRTDIPDYVAYALAKGLAEEQKDILAQFSSFELYDPYKSCLPEALGGVPLHPGAEKFYREKGYLK